LNGSLDDTTLIERDLLENKTLAITRKTVDAKEFVALVTSAGGKAIALPTIEIVPSLQIIEEALRIILASEYDLCMFMSAQAVGVLCEYAIKYGKIEKMVSVLNAKNVVAQGPVTKSSLEKYGISVRLIPTNYSSEGIVALFRKLDYTPGMKVIIPRSGMSNDFVTRSLSNLGLNVEELFLYTTKTTGPSEIWNEFAILLKEKKIDAIIFTSGSSVISFFEILHNFYDDYDQFLEPITAMISIGPLTTRELMERNISCIEPSEHTIRGTFELAKSILGSRT
jgi:uroporphyrinogen-III synthase